MAATRQQMGGLARQAARAEACRIDSRLLPGLVVNGYALAPNEPAPRMRLVVLIRQVDNTDEWQVAMLSYKSTYTSGQSRIRLADWQKAKLPQKAYIYSCNLASLLECNICKRYGRISAQDARQFARKCDLDVITARRLIESLTI